MQRLAAPATAPSADRCRCGRESSRFLRSSRLFRAFSGGCFLHEVADGRLHACRPRCRRTRKVLWCVVLGPAHARTFPIRILPQAKPMAMLLSAPMTTPPVAERARKDRRVFGMWVFLVTDALSFGALLLACASARRADGWPRAARFDLARRRRHGALRLVADADARPRRRHPGARRRLPRRAGSRVGHAGPPRRRPRARASSRSPPAGMASRDRGPGRLGAARDALGRRRALLAVRRRRLDRALHGLLSRAAPCPPPLAVALGFAAARLRAATFFRDELARASRAR